MRAWGAPGQMALASHERKIFTRTQSLGKPTIGASPCVLQPGEKKPKFLRDVSLKQKRGKTRGKFHILHLFVANLVAMGFYVLMLSVLLCVNLNKLEWNFSFEDWNQCF